MNSVKNFYTMLWLIKTDFNRYTDSWWNPFVVVGKMFVNPGMTFSVLYRFERYLLYESNDVFKLFGYIFYPVYFFITYFILSYHIEPKVKIGSGLFLHNREIVMTENVTIGNNFSCMGQTTIGRNFNEKQTEIIIGDNVLLGVGAKVIAKGKLSIAPGVVVGANAVVTKSLEEENGVYIGIPARILSKKMK